MYVIYKYQLEFLTCEIKMPEESQILSVQLQNNIPTLWAIVNTESKETTKAFRFFATGENLRDPPKKFTYQYVTTIQQNGLVWHLFEVIDYSKGETF